MENERSREIMWLDLGFDLQVVVELEQTSNTRRLQLSCCRAMMTAIFGWRCGKACETITLVTSSQISPGLYISMNHWARNGMPVLRED
jgi:hypothetical protein